MLNYQLLNIWTISFVWPAATTSSCWAYSIQIHRRSANSITSQHPSMGPDTVLSVASCCIYSEMVAKPKAAKDNAFFFFWRKAFILPKLYYQCHIALSCRQHPTDLQTLLEVILYSLKMASNWSDPPALGWSVNFDTNCNISVACLLL